MAPARSRKETESEEVCVSTFIEDHPSLFNTIKVFLVCVLIILAVNSFGFFKKAEVSLKIEDDVFSMLYQEEAVIRFTKEEISSVELLDTFDAGEALEAVSEEGYLVGEWENDVWGTYTLCINQEIETYVVVTTDERIFVFNYMNEDTTESICSALLEW